MISRQQLINKLRALGYSFNDVGDRVEMWRRPTPLHVAFVPRRSKLTVETARSILRQAGVAPTEIERFIADCKA